MPEGDICGISISFLPMFLLTLLSLVLSTQRIFRMNTCRSIVIQISAPIMQRVYAYALALAYANARVASEDRALPDIFPAYIL